MTEIVSAAKKHKEIGLADASLLTLAARLGTSRIATLDEHRFRVVQPLVGEAARASLPADA